jgi:beta-lactam-binding protein with PASTA domain
MSLRFLHRLNSRRTYTAAAVVLALGAVWFLFDGVIMPLYTRQGSEREVPSLAGLTFEQAQARADSAGFVLMMDTLRGNGGQTGDVILEQRPLAGSLAKPGRKIRVIPVAAPQPDTAPDVSGLNVRDAQLRCRNAGLTSSESDLRYRYSERTPKGVVVSQEPAAGEKVKPGSPMKLTVSLGPQPAHIYVPYLMEKSLHEARSLLLEAGLKLGKIVRKETNLYVSGRVIAQSIRSGQEVEGGTSVDVVVAVPKTSTEESNDSE